MKQTVIDTSSLIRLRKANVLQYLGVLFETVYIPQAVFEECTDTATVKAIENLFFAVRPVQNILPLGMGAGERATISLAVELGIKHIIVDDDKAFKKAMQQGLAPIASLSVLLPLKKLGKIASVKSVLDALEVQEEFIMPEVYHLLLEQAGEQ